MDKMKQLSFLITLLCINISIFSQKRPNVILIMTDDQGYGDITSHGNLKLKTPNMNKIANEGARLDNFFVSSVCAPTRAALLTGRYHVRTGVVSVSKNLDVLPAKEVTIAEVLQDNGYKTALFGKWHNGYHYPNHPKGQGFEEYFGFLGGHFPNYFNPTLDHNLGKEETKGFITDVLTDKAIEWIAENKDESFFCYIPYNAPHTPYQVPDEYFEMYKNMGFDVKTASIMGMVKNLDDNIGRIHKAMKELDLDENTILMFLSDNGPNTPQRFNAGMKGHKTHVDEGGERVPFFMKWKGKIPAGLTSYQLAAHIDILPTIAEFCNITLPKDLSLDGVSITKYLTQKNKPHFNRKIFSHRWHGNKLQPKKGAVRTQQYRYVLKSKEEGLYDIINDPGQEVNIKKKKPEKFKELKTAYYNWFDEVSEGWQVETVLPCGYSEFPVSYMSTVAAKFTGNIKFHGKGYVNDWLENWVNPADKIAWDLNFNTSGKYKFTIEYVCPKEDLGSQIKLSVGEKALKTKVKKAFDEPFYKTYDRAPRAGEMQKPWGKIEIGNLKVEKGITKMTLSANSMKGKQVMEVKAIIIEKIN